MREYERVKCVQQQVRGFTILNLICRQCATVKSSSAKPAAGNCHRIHYMQNKCNEKPIWIQVNIFYSNAQQCVQIFTFHIGRHCVLSRHKSLCMNQKCVCMPVLCLFKIKVSNSGIFGVIVMCNPCLSVFEYIRHTSYRGDLNECTTSNQDRV